MFIVALLFDFLGGGFYPVDSWWADFYSHSPNQDIGPSPDLGG
jgi:hypothetical protein